MTSRPSVLPIRHARVGWGQTAVGALNSLDYSNFSILIASVLTTSPPTRLVV